MSEFKVKAKDDLSIPSEKLRVFLSESKSETLDFFWYGKCYRLFLAKYYVACFIGNDNKTRVCRYCMVCLMMSLD